MALRNKYGYVCTKMNLANIPDLTPLGYIDVVPGETLSGTVKVNAQSAPAFRNNKNKAYLDAFAFYVPYRLLWDNFPQWITGANSDPIPKVSDLFFHNFEARHCLDYSVDQYTTHTAWQRRAYNMIGMKFFGYKSEVDDADYISDANAVLPAIQRPSTFEVASPPSTVPSAAIPTGTVDDLRAAFAHDTFEKVRAMYGDRYVDYLRALGVQTNWAVLDEPETIGMIHGPWQYRTVNATFGVTEGTLCGS